MLQIHAHTNNKQFINVSLFCIDSIVEILKQNITIKKQERNEKKQTTQVPMSHATLTLTYFMKNHFTLKPIMLFVCNIDVIYLYQFHVYLNHYDCYYYDCHYYCHQSDHLSNTMALHLVYLLELFGQIMIIFNPSLE